MAKASERTLIIAEKPSVATDLARVLGKELGKFEKKKDYFENENAIISSAVGHLVQLKMPLTPEGKKLPWSMKYLPAIPDTFELQPIERNESRFKLLVRLLKKKDVTSVVNACDAGREGELIFRYVLQLANLKKDLTIQRMWMQSMTNDAILTAWHNLRSNEEMQPLADAAMCRSESDWLVGLNGTRALTAFNSRNGGFNVTSAGRVQTPTLMILAERERLIRAFQAETYYEVHGTFSVSSGNYDARWLDESHQKEEPRDGELRSQKRAERIWSKEQAQAIVAACQGQTGSVDETRKPSKSAPPPLFDLTSLQRQGSSKHGFSASRTLQLAQSLYDRHKLLTYPRTDSKCLPEDYLDEVKKIVKDFSTAKNADNLGAGLKDCCQWLLKNDRIQPIKKVFNSAKVTDHFAIIPTGKIPTAKLDDAARKIYEMVLRRFLAVFYPSAEYENTKRITRIGEHAFLTSGKVLVVPGYLEVYGRKPGQAGDSDELVAVQDGEDAKAVQIQSKECETKPPPRYTDSTLLSAMETAGKRIDDDELREAMSERGLGTPATRANTIESLIRSKYIFRNEIRKSELVVSNKGLNLHDQLEEIGIGTISSPELTGEWEYKLNQMAEGKLDRDSFMEEIKSLTKNLVEQTRDHMNQIINRPFPDLTDAPCPEECGSTTLKQTDGTFECKTPDCTFRLKKHIAGYELSTEEARQLITQRIIGPIDTFKNRFGQPFAAELTLAKEKRSWKIGFKFEGDEERENEVSNLTDEQIICQAKILDDSDQLVNVYENERAFLAPDMATKVNERGVRISKTILKKDIPTDQGIKLFVEGKTDLMPGFISKKGRPFAAHLTLDRANGKLGFEFAPRKKATKKKTEPDADDSASASNNATKSTAKAKTTKKKTTKESVKKKSTTRRRIASDNASDS